MPSIISSNNYKHFQLTVLQQQQQLTVLQQQLMVLQQQLTVLQKQLTVLQQQQQLTVLQQQLTVLQKQQQLTVMPQHFTYLLALMTSRWILPKELSPAKRIHVSSAAYMDHGITLLLDIL
ncbi:uncharacterized protein DDB_G0286393 isoform X2 [Cherax quadricarinatus]|uniref:uncharacterized protein DDB_G0286393 isoform X2 n=1 Tax=Cherax quadricarinatus TaxID=27406 RepID=UPI00387E8B28